MEFFQLALDDNKKESVITQIEPKDRKSYYIKQNNIVLLEIKAYNPLKRSTNVIYQEDADYKNELENFFNKCQKTVIPYFVRKQKQKNQKNQKNLTFHLIFCYNGELEEDLPTTQAAIQKFNKNLTNVSGEVMETIVSVFHYYSGFI